MKATFVPRNTELRHSTKNIFNILICPKGLLGSQYSISIGEESLDFSTKYPAKVWEILSWRKFQQVIILGFLEKVITLWAFYPY